LSKSVSRGFEIQASKSGDTASDPEKVKVAAGGTQKVTEFLIIRVLPRFNVE